MKTLSPSDKQTLTLLERHKAYNGWVECYEHHSEVTAGSMRFAIFLPPQSLQHSLPVVYWLSGLTCTEHNFMQKSAALATAAELGLILVACDTSPRHRGFPGEDADADLGSGASFYVNATQEPWKPYYQMYDYVTQELPQLLAHNFALAERCSIMGHSMGGHGALVIGLRNQDKYQAISAFAPICHPTTVPWGQKAFTHYLGSDEEQWRQYDSVLLLQNTACRRPLKVDFGLADEFFAAQLRPEALEQALTKQHKTSIEIAMHPGYDHGYYFVSSFIDEHLRFHARYLK